MYLIGEFAGSAIFDVARRRSFEIFVLKQEDWHCARDADDHVSCLDERDCDNSYRFELVSDSSERARGETERVEIKRRRAFGGCLGAKRR